MYPDDFENEQEKQIGEKVGEALEQNRESLKDLEDGIEMKDGHMELSSDDAFATKKISAQRDSVFADAKEAQQPQQREQEAEAKPKTSQNPDDPLHVSVLERGGDSVKRKYYNYYAKKEEELPKKRGTYAAVTASIILIVLALIFLGVYFFFFMRDEQESADETSEEETTEGYSDLITCNISDGGVYTTTIVITLESENNNKIYYTLDGSEPDSSSDIYMEEITISVDDLTELSQEITLRAVSHTSSAHVAAEFEITFTAEMEALASPEFSLESGSYTEAQEVAIEAPEGAVIYYTYDGSEPTEESDIYTEPLQLKRGNYVLSAIAVDGERVSEASSAIYVYEPETITYAEAMTLAKEYLILEGTIENEDGDLPDGAGQILFGSAGKIESDGSYYYVIILNRYNSSDILLSTTYLAVDDITGDVYSAGISGGEYIIGSMLREQ